MAGLSIVCSARAVSERLLVLLESVRPVADELVVAVDERGARSLGAAEPLADVVATYEFADAIERQWAWVASLASGRWLLWIDDDELPSAALLRCVNELVSAPDVTHYQLRRRWLYASPETYLDEPPWEPEFVPRLFRVDPALVTYPGRVHLPMRLVGPFRWVDAPLYHLDLLLNSEEQRRSKIAAYEALDPGRRVAGRPLNEAFYVPEGRGARTSAVAEDDLPLLRRFVASSAAPLDRPPAVAVVRGVRAAIDELFEGRAATDEDYAGRLDPRPASTWLAGVERAVEVVVTNESARAWHPVGSGGFEVALGSRWRRADGSLLGEGLRTSIPAILPPGESTLVSADVIPPAEPGAYVLELDLVQEHVRWFGVPATLEVTVVPYRRVGIVALDADLALVVAARLTAQRPDQGLAVLVPGDEEIRAPYPVEKLDVRRHVGELDRLYVAGSPEQARKRVRASLLEARLLARRRGVEIVVLRRAEDL